jgi:hypothetical protein
MSTENKIAEVKEELSLIEKVSLMHDLASACKDKNVVSVLQGLPNGEKIFNIFVSAIERELSSVMNGKKEEIPQQVNDLLSALNHLNSSTKQFRELISGFMGTPLVEVLNMMNKNLGGKYYQLSDGTQSPLSQSTQQQQLQPAQAQQEYRSGPPSSGRGSTMGNF